MKLIHQPLLDEAADPGIGKGVCQGVWDQSHQWGAGAKPPQAVWDKVHTTDDVQIILQRRQCYFSN